MHRFGLSPADMGRVESAVIWGHELQGERLRQAAVVLGREELERRRRHSPWARWAAAAALLLASGGVIVLYALNPDHIPWGLLLFWGVSGPAAFRMARGPGRAVELNSEGPQ
jgi:hypothetical protein